MMLQQFTTPLAFLLMKSEGMPEQKEEEHLQKISELISTEPGMPSPGDAFSHPQRTEPDTAKLPLSQSCCILSCIPPSPVQVGPSQSTRGL